MVQVVIHLRRTRGVLCESCYVLRDEIAFLRICSMCTRKRKNAQTIQWVLFGACILLVSWLAGCPGQAVPPVEQQCPPCECDCESPTAGKSAARQKNKAQSKSLTEGSIFVTNLSEFKDHTERFKGKRLRIPSTVWTNPGVSIRRFIGKSTGAPFRAEDFDVEFRVYIPDGLEVPNATFSEEVMVIFDCNEGSLRRGNVAKSVKRLE